jgi:hypothetical protein
MRDLALGTIHQERRGSREEPAQQVLDFLREHGLLQCRIHQLHPAVTRLCADWESGMADAESRMPALFDIGWWSAESIDEEISEALLGALQIVPLVHRPQHVITGNLLVERSHKALEPVVSDGCVDLVLFH